MKQCVEQGIHNEEKYKSVSFETDKCYIGSTTRTYSSERSGAHKGDYRIYQQGKRRSNLSCFELLQHNDCKILLIENYPCDSKYELEARERYWIEQEPTSVDKNTPTRAPKEHYEANKETFSENNKQYRQAHKEEIKERMKQYYEANKERIKERDRNRYEATKERQKLYSKKYDEANKERIKDKRKNEKRKIFSSKLDFLLYSIIYNDDPH